ncbi:MAG: hypothetical protein ACN4GG_09140 [Akkermansiaceae bacterium]
MIIPSTVVEFWSGFLLVLLTTPLLLTKVLLEFKKPERSKKWISFWGGLLFLPYAVLAAFMCDPFFGSSHVLSEKASIIALLCLGIFVAFLLLTFLDPKRYLTEKVQIAQLCFPPYLCSLIILGFMTKAYYLEELHWRKIDPLAEQHEVYPDSLTRISFEKTKELLDGIVKGL